MSKISELSDGGSLVSSDYLIAVRSGGNVKVRMDQINVDQVDLGDNEFIRLGNSQDLTMVHNASNSIINQAGIGDLLIQKAGTTKASITANGLEFPDNSKAIFGAGSDLQIYHDGSHSYVSDQGTGSLRVLAENFQVRNPANNEAMIIAIPDSGVTLYHNNAAKLSTSSSGISVAGSVTADGLTVDGDGLLYSASNVEMRGDANVRISLGTAGTSGANNNSNWIYGNGTNLRFNNAGGYYSWETLGTERLRLDANGTLLLTTPFGGAYGYLNIKEAGSGDVRFGKEAGNDYDAIAGTWANNAMKFYTNSVERMRISSDGNVGIGTSSPQNTLDLSSTSPQIRLADTDAIGYSKISGSGGNIYLQADEGNTVASSKIDFRVDGSQRMVIDDSGRVGIGRTPSLTSSKLEVGGADNVSLINVEASGVTGGLGIGSTGLQFFHGSSAKMRIDSAGNLLVGKTSTSGGIAGTVLAASGLTRLTASGIAVAEINRLGSNGSVVDFKKDGATVGSIGTESGYLAVGSPNGQSGYLGFRTNMVYPSTSTGANRDDIIDLGGSSQRFDDIYATNGTIQTSDRNEKQDIAELSDAEQRVAVAAKGLLRKFRWKSSVAEKGDEARTHFGIIAQDLQAAFAAEGLDAGDYAMFINSTWTDEETGEERSRMGVRYSELLAFIIAAI